MRAFDGKRIYVIVYLALSLLGCQHESKTSSSSAPKTKGQSDKTSVPNVTVYSSSEVTIQRGQARDFGYGYFSKPDGVIEIQGDLFRIICLAAPEIIRNKAVIPDGYYYVHIASPNKEMAEGELKSRAWKLIVPAFEKAFHLCIRHVRRKEEIFVLQIQDSGLRNVKKAKESDSWGWGTAGHGYEFRKFTFAQLCKHLSGEIGEVVLDETEDNNTYFFKVPIDVFDDQNADAWITGLSQVGLKLQKAGREIELSDIEDIPSSKQSASPPQSPIPNP
jgi:hypothetical protein